MAYFSKGLDLCGQNKPIYEKELMAIVLAIQKWRHYLLRPSVYHMDESKEIEVYHGAT